MDLATTKAYGVHINFDVDFLSIIHVNDVYKSELGYKNVEHIYVLETRMDINEGPFFSSG